MGVKYQAECLICEWSSEPFEREDPQDAKWSAKVRGDDHDKRFVHSTRVVKAENAGVSDQ